MTNTAQPDRTILELDYFISLVDGSRPASGLAARTQRQQPRFDDVITEQAVNAELIPACLDPD